MQKCRKEDNKLIKDVREKKVKDEGVKHYSIKQEKSLERRKYWQK